MTNCSTLAYESLKKSGRLSRAQAMYLAIFKEFPDRAMSHEEATGLVYDHFRIMYAPRNGRVRELEKKGFLKKVGTDLNEFHNRVSVYQWTGRTEPLEMESVLEPCQHCGCTRKHRTMKAVDPKQGRMEI